MATGSVVGKKPAEKTGLEAILNFAVEWISKPIVGACAFFAVVLIIIAIAGVSVVFHYNSPEVQVRAAGKAQAEALEKLKKDYPEAYQPAPNPYRGEQKR